mgnify:FL=1
MTKREFYSAIINNAVTSEVIAMAEDELKAMTEKSTKLKAKNEEKNAAGFAAIREFFAGHGDGQALTSEVAEFTDMTTSKASALLRKMAESGELVQEDVKVSGKGTRKAYRLA